ncbi:MAG TPA: hypothetical protein VL500_05000 [Candidatus Eisenbacteria bacterium]|nr:hypothetical protein [Candidatus Eisenbacteria bacterium]
MWQWLLRPVSSVREGFQLFVLALAGSLGWSIFISLTLQPALAAPGGRFDPTALGWAAIPLIAVSVFIEECLRLAPLAVTVRIAPRNATAVLGAAAVTAALFGAAHVTNGLPLHYVLVCQGVVGFVMNLLYLKVGGLHGHKVRGFLFALAFHLTFDLVIIVPVLLLRGA